MEPVDEMIEVADGVRLRARTWPGRNSGAPRPPFLLVHGLSSNALLWDQVAVRLSAAGYPCYAVDLRSHGGSDSPASGYDTATAARDVAAVHGRLGLRPAIAVGQSWGGDVVVRLAARHPDVVAALALVDGGWVDLAAGFDSWADCERALRPPELGDLRPDQFRQRLRGAHPDWSAGAIDATVANLRTTADGWLRRRLPIDRHMSIVRSMWDDPPGHDFPAIAVPVLLLPAAALRGVDRAAAALPAARVKRYPGGDHDLHAQHPDELAADLLELAAER